MQRRFLGLLLSVAQTLSGIGMLTASAADRATPLSTPLMEHTPAVLGTPPKGADEPQGNLVLKGDIQATLVTDKGTTQLRGRVSAHLRASKEDLEKGQVGVRALNVVYFGVPQQDITGQKPRGKETGALGFMVAPDREEQFLAYDPLTRRLQGKLAGQLDMPQFADLVKTPDDEKTDVILTPTQPAVLAVSLVLGDKLGLEAGQSTVRQFQGRLDMDLAAEAVTDLQLSGYRIAVRRAQLQVEITWIPFFEVAKRLCIQPVRIASLKFSGGFPPLLSLQLSGDGLAFGLPGANTQ